VARISLLRNIAICPVEELFTQTTAIIYIHLSTARIAGCLPSSRIFRMSSQYHDGRISHVITAVQNMAIRSSGISMPNPSPADCGPFVELRETHSQFPTTDPRVSSIEIRTSAILKARRLLREGYIVAIKGLGGFHLACDASNPYTVAELRDRKGRVDTPFAVMAVNLTAVASVCEMNWRKGYWQVEKANRSPGEKKRSFADV
jgi:hypothetical protein